jgi:drug/metabolite transporter (DMT)-like permease
VTAVAAGGARPGTPAWSIWLALVTVWVLWGSGYLASRVMVETMPALLGAGMRFVLAGAVMLAIAALRHGIRGLRATRFELLGALVIGSLISGANAVGTVAMQEVPAGLAALLFAALPLWIIVLRLLARERVARATVISMLVGFAGTALVLRPGEQSGDATLLGLAACVGAALMCALGSFALPRFKLPRDLFVSAGWQMLLAGLALELAGLAFGEAREVDLAAFSSRSVVSLAYLVVFCSVVAYTAYVWLLDRAPLSQVSTFAYVNPIVAIALGWLLLDETVTGTTIAGASIIIVSVALVVRVESPDRMAV